MPYFILVYCVPDLVSIQLNFLSEEEGRLKAARAKEGADAATSKGKSKKLVPKPKDQPVIVDDDSN